MEAHIKKIMSARTALILDQPFFGVLALRLKLKADPSCPTAWVDGRTLGYNPKYIESLSSAQLIALVAHEVMHCACGHPWRRDHRDMYRWNEACDYAINPILEKSGFMLYPGAYLDDAYKGKGAEWIYDRLPDSEQEQDGGGQPESEEGDGSDDGQGAGGKDGDQPDIQGEVRDAPSNAHEDGSTEGDWSAAVQQAANAADAQNKLPKELKRFAEDGAKSRVDWRSVLRRFMQDITMADYTWARPNRRYVSQGLYLPALHSDEMGPIVIAIDTSGSIDNVLLGKFNVEVQAIVDESKPSSVTVMYCDEAVCRTDIFERGDPVNFDPIGGSGTKFGPVFDAVEELDDVPACIIYLTDLEPWGPNAWPANEPGVPTLWAATEDHEVPFGEVIFINE